MFNDNKKVYLHLNIQSTGASGKIQTLALRIVLSVLPLSQLNFLLQQRKV